MPGAGAGRGLSEYAPIVMLKAQQEACDSKGEQYAPSSVDIVLDNPDVVLRQVGNNDPVIKIAPSAFDLFGLSEGFYLDYPGGALAPGCIYEKDFDRYSETGPGDRRALVYAHIARQDDRPDEFVLQYWFYWYFNDWNNKHEGDWEGIQLLFDTASVEEALTTEPVSVGYAQHEGGEHADWDSDKLERDGDRPVVYPSAGSHASYYGSALYLGRSASEGFGCDTTDGPSDRVGADVVLLPTNVEDPDDPLAWLTFGGRWGERQSGAFNGPTGPLDKERWTNPIDWHDELRSDGVVVPAGDTQGDVIVNSFCNVVEWGSATLITLKTTPLRLVIVLGLVFFAIRWLVRRTVWGRVPARPLVMRRRAGC
ncbi:MAG: Vps62-related protein [Actinobacteria bacterium]|nr:Vps62-related protein [Actinomycetota bacterium]